MATSVVLILVHDVWRMRGKGGKIRYFRQIPLIVAEILSEKVNGSPRKVPSIFRSNATEFHPCVWLTPEMCRAWNFRKNPFSTEADTQPKSYFVLKVKWPSTFAPSQPHADCSACVRNWRYKVSVKYPYRSRDTAKKWFWFSKCPYLLSDRKQTYKMCGTCVEVLDIHFNENHSNGKRDMP